MMTSSGKATRARRRRPAATREKVAVSLPRSLVAAAREEVKLRRAASVSALVTQALEEKLERDRLQEVLDQMAAEHGPLTPEDLAWADRLLEG